MVEEFFIFLQKVLRFEKGKRKKEIREHKKAK